MSEDHNPLPPTRGEGQGQTWDGWVKWHGGENPVPGCLVMAQLRIESRATAERDGCCQSDDLRWSHLRSKTLQGDGDIIAYRVIDHPPGGHSHEG